MNRSAEKKNKSKNKKPLCHVCKTGIKACSENPIVGVELQVGVASKRLQCCAVLSPADMKNVTGEAAVVSVASRRNLACALGAGHWYPVSATGSRLWGSVYAFWEAAWQAPDRIPPLTEHVC